MKRILLSCLLCIGLALPGVALSDGHEENTSVSLYGRLWPKVTYTSPSDDDPKTDITDALSRIGVTADYKLSETLTAVVLAEVRVNLGHDGSQDFFTEHLGYVSLESSDLGTFAIGTQWNPYYNIVAAVTDVYYHRSSPFGYDYRGPFRTEQIVRYAYGFSGVSLDLGAQLKGQHDEGTEDFDELYAGVGYSYGPVYVGIGYLGRETAADRHDYVGLGASWSVTDDLYLAVTYQSIQHEQTQDQETLDVAATYSFGLGYTLIGGFFSYENGKDASDPELLGLVGYNLTLVKSLTSNVRVFAEWLRKDFQEGGREDETEDALSLGLRISFDAKII